MLGTDHEKKDILFPRLLKRQLRKKKKAEAKGACASYRLEQCMTDCRLKFVDLQCKKSCTNPNNSDVRDSSACGYSMYVRIVQVCLVPGLEWKKWYRKYRTDQRNNFMRLLLHFIFVLIQV